MGAVTPLRRVASPCGPVHFQEDSELTETKLESKGTSSNNAAVGGD